ncbi:putative GTP binding domain, P-loop containing nucleoside triphosphate hydrolase [Helianthus annuus]|uniref:GTP binding domain, P-loop containing nucleoside triphosphate hydrolase n=1 Tax=Helianthus annuus TaxID=4232 RepID=A0A251VQJ4_HELAN|nr:DAR GTPase 2, mitochondrial isoform X1 [Helianthus annuus]KAF5823147.1 putative GTP binding domain, P-loop containing nucleoside triphosphate hydrolase [Helianthus annuus]
MAGTTSFAQKLGNSVKKVSENKSSSWWYNHHMRAASRAISQRIPLVDFVLEVRDARVPVSSEYGSLRYFPSSSRNIIILNKMDLASHSKTKEWMAYFKEQNYITYAINSHNKDNIKEFLNFLQAKIRDLRRNMHLSNTLTTTVMLVGIPNVGKSAFANSLHQIGRVTAAEKGKLKQAKVSPHPGETKDIISLKIASHPNVYILDTPGILPPEIADVERSSKLALTGAIADYLFDQSELAQYFLSILNLSHEYKKWGKISESDKENQIMNDHTQDLVVQAVRRALFEEISAFDGNLEDENDMVQLIEAQFTTLRKVFNVNSDSFDTANNIVASKLVNLYRTGRLGHYTLDSLPRTNY